jgi:hypothetical protein
MGAALDDDAPCLRTVVRRVTGGRRPTGPAAVLHRPALVRPVDPVLDGRLARAAPAAPPQLGVERFEQLRRDSADRLVAERGVEVHAGVLLVAFLGALLDVEHPEPRIHRRAEARLGLRRTLLVDLGAEPLEEGLGLRLASHRAGKPDLLPGQRVEPGVDQHLEGVAALADVPARPARADLLGHPPETTR